MNGTKVGEVVHFYDRLSVAVINVHGVLKIGDSVHFLGHGSDFQQSISSMQIENDPIVQANSGDLVALKTIKPVRRGTTLYVLSE